MFSGIANEQLKFFSESPIDSHILLFSVASTSWCTGGAELQPGPIWVIGSYSYVMGTCTNFCKAFVYSCQGFDIVYSGRISNLYQCKFYDVCDTCTTWAPGYNTHVAICLRDDHDGNGGSGASTEESGASIEVPESTANWPKATTDEPEATTNGPGSTADEPEATTVGNRSTIEGPEATIDVPGSTIETPEATTDGSGSTIEGPETTDGLGSNIEGSKATSAGPESSIEGPEVTDGPGSTTEVPDTTTDGPGSTIEGPEATTDDPGSTIEGPKVTTDGSGSTIEGPQAKLVLLDQL